MKTPEVLTPKHVAKRWPRLYHMAEAGSWPSVQQHGLLSTTALLDLYGVTGPEREAIESVRRKESVRIEHPKYGEAWIRDNKPINETVLRRTLTGMTEREWYRTLNSRVFFWLTEERLDKLRQAGAYKAREHDILTFDTEALLERYGANGELAPINTGAVHGTADYARGAGTFQRIDSYPWQARLATNRSEPIVELTVPYSVPDAADLVIRRETR